MHAISLIAICAGMLNTLRSYVVHCMKYQEHGFRMLRRHFQNFLDLYVTDFITATSKERGLWILKTSASRLFTQQCVQISNKRNTKAPHLWPSVPPPTPTTTPHPPPPPPPPPHTHKSDGNTESVAMPWLHNVLIVQESPRLNWSWAPVNSLPPWGICRCDYKCAKRQLGY